MKGEISLKILKGVSIEGTVDRALLDDCCMLSRYGEVYDCIDGVMHPNPGTEETQYDEIERTVDWILSIPFYKMIGDCTHWIEIKVAKYLKEFPDSTLDEVILNTMYTDLYEPCDMCKNIFADIYDMFTSSLQSIEAYANSDDIVLARKITTWLNENFLRVRTGGKFNPEGADAIYFRISSHGYDWHRVIVDFLWDTFGEPNKMPKQIWIGTDAETNPPERVYFNGTPEELFNQYDERVYASYNDKRRSTLERYKNIVNKDILKYRIDKQFLAVSKIKYE